MLLISAVVVGVSAFVGYLMGRAHEKALQQVQKDLEDRF